MDRGNYLKNINFYTILLSFIYLFKTILKK